MYLLDTNHCSRILEADTAVLAQLQEHADALIATNVIVQGELIYMARQSEQKTANLARVDAFLRGIRIYPIDSETAILYGSLKAQVMQQFGPKEKRKRRLTNVVQLGFDDNDLWIAASALRHGLAVVSADGDFRRMQEAQPFALESWWTPPVPSV